MELIENVTKWGLIFDHVRISRSWCVRHKEKVKFQRQLADKEIFVMVFQTFGIDLPKKPLIFQFFYFFRYVTHLSFWVSKSVGKAHFPKELLHTKHVLHFICEIMSSLKAPSFKEP